jgi:nucleotide-binding universal stress UspA family protein
MVYVDGSEQSLAAAMYAVLLSSSLGAELHALSVVNSSALGELVRSHIFLESEKAEYQRELEADAARYLDEARELARRKGVSLVTATASGSVHAEIRKSAVERGIDLLVLGEFSGVRSRRDEFYDETERAMRSAPCSVLVVKADARIQELYESP